MNAKELVEEVEILKPENIKRFHGRMSKIYPVCVEELKRLLEAEKKDGLKVVPESYRTVFGRAKQAVSIDPKAFSYVTKKKTAANAEARYHALEACRLYYTRALKEEVGEPFIFHWLAEPAFRL